METRSNNLPPNPPNVISAFVRGFNAIASQAGVILIPIVFDLFLWLGPRFSIYNLILPVLAEMERTPEQNQSVLENIPLFYEFFEGFNAFSTLRTFPLGIFSLMNSSIAMESPFGLRNILEVDGFLLFLFGLMLMTVAGWIFGGFYFYYVAKIVVERDNADGAGTVKIHAIGHGLLLSAFWSVLWVFIGVTILVILGVLLLISPVIISIVYFLLTMSALWLAVPVFFSAHGIFLTADNFIHSTVKSFRLMRYAFPSVGWFVVIAMLLSQGLNFLWRIAPADSWMTLFGIFGHAFISTALLAASFIYYRDLNDWVERALAWTKARTDSVQA